MRHARLAIALLAVPAFACALPVDERAAREFRHTLQPGAVAEECVRLEAGRSRAFEWTSDAALDFNIHYHAGDKVSYPVKLGNQKKGRGKFTASTSQDYCWMWSAKFPTQLSGRLGPEE